MQWTNVTTFIVDHYLLQVSCHFCDYCITYNNIIQRNTIYCNTLHCSLELWLKIYLVNHSYNLITNIATFFIVLINLNGWFFFFIDYLCVAFLWGTILNSSGNHLLKVLKLKFQMIISFHWVLSREIFPEFQWFKTCCAIKYYNFSF